MPREWKIDLIAGNADEVGENLVIRVRVARTAQVARVLAVPAAVFLVEVLDNEDASTAFVRGQCRASSGIAAPNDQYIALFRNQVSAPIGSPNG